MLSTDTPLLGPMSVPYESDPRCEDCGCSVVPRFGGTPNYLCVSCVSDEDLEWRAGKIMEMVDDEPTSE